MLKNRTLFTGNRLKRHGYAWLWLSAVVLTLDQISKLAIIRTIDLHQVIVLTPFFNLVHVLNPGAAFGLLADQPGWQRTFFIVIALVASGVILYLMRQTAGQTRFNLALALILGGAIGNAIDRILYGHVIDFLDIHVAGWHWPAFNVADFAISIGAALLIWDSLRKPNVDERA